VALARVAGARRVARKEGSYLLPISSEVIGGELSGEGYKGSGTIQVDWMQDSSPARTPTEVANQKREALSSMYGKGGHGKNST